MERLNCENQQFSKGKSASRNVCVNSTNKIVNEIYNGSCCKISYSHDLSSDNLNKRLEPEECVPAYQCDKPSDYVFVDVGSNLAGSEYLIEEDDDISKVSCEILFTDKDIDYNLFKNVTMERCLKNSSKESEIHNHILETTVSNINNIGIVNDWSGLSTNAHMTNICENLYDYDKKPSIDTDCTTTSTVVSTSGGFEKVNMYVKEEKSVEDVLVPQSTDDMSIKIKKEEIVYNEEVSVLNESIIEIKLHPVEESLDISTNYTRVLDKNIQTGFTVLSKRENSGYEEVHVECSEEVPDNTDIDDVMDLKPLEKSETLQNKRESHLKLQNKVQTLTRTWSELQIKPQTNSRDDTGAAVVEECNDRLNEDVSTQAKNKTNAVCQHHRKSKSTNTTERHCVCKVCNKNFTPLCDVKAHKCTHTDDRPFGCDTCGKTFAHKNSLTNHNRIHTGDRPFGCDTCGKTFALKRSLTSHNRIHTGDRPFGCDSCGKTFAHKRTLTNHKRIHIGDRPFGCDTCGKTFTLKCSLKRHILIHTGDRSFGCDTCGKTFIQKGTLKDHIYTIHTGDRPFSCDTCGKTFRAWVNLKRHKHRHTGDRSYGCNACGKTFTQKGTLKDHVHSIHIGDRPFGCDTCGKTFTRVSHLKNHILIHTGDKPFRCDTCGKTFRVLSHLKRHKTYTHR